MTTAADLIAETRSNLLGGLREAKNKLSADIGTSDTTIAFTYTLGSISAGQVLSIGLERMYVWSTGTGNAVVERAWDGTTAATHTAGDIVTVNARADDFTILRAINHDLDALSSPANGVYRPVAVELTYNAGALGFDITGSATMVGAPLRVEAKAPGLVATWSPLAADQWSWSPNADTTDFPSGNALFLKGGTTSGYPVRVIYGAPFTHLAALVDDVQFVAHLPATANDLPAMGAALSIASERPLRRSDVDAQATRRAEDVTTQDTLIAVSGLDKRRQSRIRDEAARLEALYG